ncbi:kinase-like protein [Gloeophyllum trabeum ATCC 11539]|uniref:Kinase-like protein n=1 Tax=Gloeophyllum trabeum (strain ATCC 11539 / FP-39264 / Madison 617) TaxID=670483 RepID=S7RBQ4_GLOTA|nr:kinase-like protein [Gloeophyllum trabeum ATCC 11539]EPQ51680.1 kinase-like protein [Gloeophyllum trabeum ATCC 11539]
MAPKVHFLREKQEQRKPRTQWTMCVAYLQEDGSEIVYDRIPSFTKVETDSHIGFHQNHRVVIRNWRLCRDDYRSPDTIKLLMREVNEWKQFRHRHIVKFVGLADTLAYIPSIVYPYYKNGNILQYLEKNPRADVLRLLHGVASALAYMHTREVPAIHGSVKSTNVLIDDTGEALLNDYGMTRVPDFAIHFARPTNLVFQEARWLAPEFFNYELVQNDRMGSTPETDTYSFGMLCLEVYTGQKPFAERRFHADDMLDVGRGAHPLRPNPDKYPLVTDDIWDIMQACWQLKPENRVKMPVVKELFALQRIMQAIETPSGK